MTFAVNEVFSRVDARIAQPQSQAGHHRGAGYGQHTKDAAFTKVRPGEPLRFHDEDADEDQHARQSRAEGEQERQTEPELVHSHGKQIHGDFVPTWDNATANTEDNQAPPTDIARRIGKRMDVSMFIMEVIGFAVVMIM